MTALVTEKFPTGTSLPHQGGMSMKKQKSELHISYPKQESKNQT